MRKTVAKGTAARKKSTTSRAKKVGAGRTAKKGLPVKKGRPVKPDRSKVAVGTTRKAAFPSEAKRKALRPKAPADTVAAAPHAEPAPERPDPARPRAVLIAQAGLDKKAEDVLVLDVRGLTSYADYFVLMTADSDRQAGAIADSVDEKMKANSSTARRRRGY